MIKKKRFVLTMVLLPVLYRWYAQIFEKVVVSPTSAPGEEAQPEPARHAA